MSEHTDLHIAYDTAANLFLPGTGAALRQRATQCLTDFSLDFERTNANVNGPNMTISSVQVNGVDVAFTFKQPTYPGNPNGPDDPDPLAHAISNVNPVSATNPNPPACSPSVATTRRTASTRPTSWSSLQRRRSRRAPPHRHGGTTPDAPAFTSTVTAPPRAGSGSTPPAAPDDCSFVTTEPVGSMAWMPVNNHPAPSRRTTSTTPFPSGRPQSGAGELARTTFVRPGDCPTRCQPAGRAVPRRLVDVALALPRRGISNYLLTNSIGSYDLTSRIGPLTGIRFYTCAGQRSDSGTQGGDPGRDRDPRTARRVPAEHAGSLSVHHGRG